jgi:hypothetical protein
MLILTFTLQEVCWKRVCSQEQSLPGENKPSSLHPGIVATARFGVINLKPGAKEGRLVPFQSI